MAVAVYAQVVQKYGLQQIKFTVNHQNLSALAE